MKRHLIIIAALIILVPRVLLAKDELTLEDLAATKRQRCSPSVAPGEQNRPLPAVGSRPVPLLRRSGDMSFQLGHSVLK